MAVPKDWKDAAVAITPGFETTGDPYEGVSGDFDGMGVSCGALQWNIGQGSLQPMVKAIGQSRVLELMPTCGEQMWRAVNSQVQQGLTIVRSWQTPGKKLKPAPRVELAALMGSAEGRAQQDRRIGQLAQSVKEQADAWAAASGETTDKRLFCWFFDLVTQNGGLKGITPKHVTDFIKLEKPGNADDVVCAFLKNAPDGADHARDARRNGALWLDAGDDLRLSLLVASYLRSAKSDPRWRYVVLNRKGAIAMGVGYVNGKKHDLSGFGL